MADKKILVFRDQIESLCRMGRKFRVIGAKDDLVMVEEVSEETDEVELEGW